VVFYLKKNVIFSSCNFFQIFGHTNPRYGSGSGSVTNEYGYETLVSRKGRPSYKKKKSFSSQKRTSSTSKHEISLFFLLLRVIFPLLDLDPDPDSEYGSGSRSTDLIES
jgi:hypothetical protein